MIWETNDPQWRMIGSDEASVSYLLVITIDFILNYAPENLILKRKENTPRRQSGYLFVQQSLTGPASAWCCAGHWGEINVPP